MCTTCVPCCRCVARLDVVGKPIPVTASCLVWADAAHFATVVSPPALLVVRTSPVTVAVSLITSDAAAASAALRLRLRRLRLRRRWRLRSLLPFIFDDRCMIVAYMPC